MWPFASMPTPRPPRLDARDAAALFAKEGATGA
jgi:hypothetical protein